jgi:hypothetical protein
MRKLQHLLNASEKVRQTKRVATMSYLSDDFMTISEFEKESTGIGFLCWLNYLDMKGKSQQIPFMYSYLSKDNDLPILYAVSGSFKKYTPVARSMSNFDNLGVKSIPSWTKVLKNSTISDRKVAKNIAENAILKYNRGKVTQKGKELISFLDGNCEFLGFIPHVAYIKDQAKVKTELKSVWVHPFAQRTLLYKIKDSPCFVIVNSSIEFNDSALAKIEENCNIDDLNDIAGITG